MYDWSLQHKALRELTAGQHLLRQRADDEQMPLSFQQSHFVPIDFPDSGFVKITHTHMIRPFINCGKWDPTFSDFRCDRYMLHTKKLVDMWARGRHVCVLHIIRESNWENRRCWKCDVLESAFTTSKLIMIHKSDLSRMNTCAWLLQGTSPISNATFLRYDNLSSISTDTLLRSLSRQSSNSVIFKNHCCSKHSSTIAPDRQEFPSASTHLYLIFVFRELSTQRSQICLLASTVSSIGHLVH